MSHASYDRDCKDCGKRITLGIDDVTQKWRPWDNYERKIIHQCSSKKIQQSVTVKNDNELLDQLNSIKNNQASIMWMLQKIAAKLGIESSGQS